MGKLYITDCIDSVYGLYTMYAYAVNTHLMDTLTYNPSCPAQIAIRHIH